MRNHPSYGIGLGRVPLRTAGLYALFGLLWIWLSDVALIWLGFDPNSAFLVGAIKGTVYVSITAALLHWLVRREVLAAEQSERLLRAVVEGTTDAVFAKDREGRYLLANEAVARFIGKPVSEVVGHDDRELFEAADAERIIANDRAIMADRKVVSFEELITSRGVKRTYHATKAPLFDSSGDVAGVIGVSRDITERRATEDALRDSEQRYRRLADAIPQIVWTASSDGAITHVNSIAVNYSGLNLADLAGWSWERAIHPDDRSHALSEWSLAIGDGVPRTFEMRLRRADGEYRWHMARQCPIRNASGVIESWVGTCTDIDDLRQAENALRETETRLREAQRIALLGSWSWEPQTDKVSWSDAEFELFNVTQDDVNPGLEAFLSLLHPDDRHIALGRVESMKAGASEFANDMRIVRPGGETIWIHSRARATRDADGHIVRVEGTDQDITARRLAELAAQESERQLQAAIEVAGLGIIVIDYNSQMATLSTRAAKQFAVSPETTATTETLVPRAELHARFHPEDRPEFEQLLANALEPDGTGWFALEHRVVWPDGTTRWLYVRKQISFADGHPHHAVVVTMDVTDRRHAEEALRASEARYRLLFESNPHPMWVFNTDSFRFLAVNDAAVQAYGYSREEFLGMTINDIRPAEDVSRLTSFVAELSPGLAGPSLWRHQRKDGTLFDVEGSSHGLPDAGGRSRLVMALDVTDRLLAERELRSERDRFEKVMEAVPAAICSFQLAPDGRVSMPYASPRIEPIYGVSPASLAENASIIFSAIHRDDAERVQKSIDESAQNLTLWRDEFRVHSPVSGEIWVEGCSAPMRLADGSVLWHGYVTNITDRKQVVDALRESERRLRLTLDAAGAISFFWDIRNDVVSRFFSTEPSLPVTAERLGTLNDVRARIHADDLAGFDAQLAASLAAGSEYRNQFRVVRPDGSSATLEEYGYVNRDADGVPCSLTGISIDISERISATEALRVSEERLRVALQGARGGVWDWDLSSGNVWWSPEVYELMGAPEGMDTREAQAVQLIYESDRQMVLTAIADALARRVDYHCEFRVHGGTRWLSSHARLFCNAAGDPIRLLGISWDISDRMIAMEALRESEERYRRLVAVLPTAVFVHNGNRVLYSNPAFNHLIGAESVHEVFERHPIDLVHPDDRPLMQSHAEERIATEEPLSGREIRFTRIDGRAVPTYCVSTPITGYGPHALLVAVTDLTERERAMQLLRSVLSSVGDAILTIDEHGVIGTANPAAVRQFGYIDDELIGLSVAALMQEPFVQEHEGYLFSYLKTGEPKVIGLGREVGCRRRDGSVFPAELTVTEFALDGERRFTGVLRDITERKRLQTQFSQAQKMEAIGRLAGGIAHDFNNLLTIISGYCELLMMSDIPAGDKRRESIAAIRDAGERAARLTQQLLAFSRKAVIEPKLIDLNEMVSDSAKLLRRLIGEDIVLVVITAPRPIPIKADPGQLEQVIMNLVVNARDAMPTGGRLTIETATILSSDGSGTEVARLSVSDTGQGMSDDVKEKIFEPFFTTKGVGKGTGLGLAVVHGVVTQSGGQVVIQSDVGVGTTFEILLPLVTDPPSTASVDSARYASRGTETVLLVEDDKAVRRITRISLQSQGYTVLEASNGVAGLQQAETYPGEIHLLISDVVMPEMGGRQLLDAVRKHRPELRVLFMSGYTDDAVLLHGVIEATDAFIQKPFTPLSLARKVREVIDAPRS
jgi:PAS domain S-box-containing protein